MGLRTKFNLMLLIAAVVGLGVFALAATPILNGLARQDVLQDSRIMMEAASGARTYTAAEVAPLLEPSLRTTFHPQAVSAYAAKKTLMPLAAQMSDYTYREAALNPTNLDDKASDWEADIINDFRAHPDKQEVVVQRQTPEGDSLVLARPLTAKPACLVCHSTAAAAPASMIAIYGPQNGFGWKANEIIAAQIVSVPMSVPLASAAHGRLLLLAVFAGVFALLFVLLNLLLGFTVIEPINRMAHTAEAVSLGKMDTPEYSRGGADQIAKLSSAINRLRRSLQEALHMLSDG
jgi:HAMP domain-containing protein